MNFRGRPLIEHALAAAARWDPVVVAGPEVRMYLDGRAGVVVLSNDQPELGMSHSLGLANQFLPKEIGILVLLGDMPLIGEALIQTIDDAADGADFVYPVVAGEPGHPVRLSPRARARIDALPLGDTLRQLRGDSHLVRRAVPLEDRGAVYDLDTAADFD